MTNKLCWSIAAKPNWVGGQGGGHSQVQAPPNPLAALQSMKVGEVSMATGGPFRLPGADGNKLVKGMLQQVGNLDNKKLEHAKIVELLIKQSGQNNFNLLLEKTGQIDNKKQLQDSTVQGSSQPHRSPQPTPDASQQQQSPPQQPQSTSTEDHPDSSSVSPTKTREDNALLKQLLNQEDEVEEETQLTDKTGQQQASDISTTAADLSNASNNVEIEKNNEAEPKKTNNILLKVCGSNDKNISISGIHRVEDFNQGINV